MQQDRHARGGVSPTPGDPLLGRLLDRRYRIAARIARGGMASVYEATDIRLDRTVAVKIMHPGLGDDDEFAARFVREARAAARLSHPHVVAVYDQGNDDGVVFLAMELVPGRTLRDTISKESPMTPSRALALMEPVLSALASAHRAGLIHRDVKPENVLIADDGRVKVADFGLAKAVSADTHHTANQGVLIGTVSYLAPELVVEGTADARADVYAAGVVLYELLTGSKPHEGESPIQVAYKHVHHDVPAPSRRAPGVPAYVDALVARATARDRSLRPADAAVMLHQLHRVSHALAHGVRDDPELTLDLAPMPLAAPVDTAAEAWDEAEMAELLAPSSSDREHTAAYPLQRPPPAHPPRDLARVPRSTRPPRQRRSARGPILLVLALALASLAGVGAYWFGWARYTSAPGVIGVTQTQAEQRLSSSDLDFDYADPVYSKEVGQGFVLDAEPAAGSRILPGDTVILTLSLGPLKVPKLRGMTEDRAQDALQDVQLVFGESLLRFSEGVAEGTVLGSRPGAGETLRPGATVNLVISKGRRPIEVGSWVGKDIDVVRAALERRGLVANVVSEEFDDEAPAGDVLDQDPPGDSTLFRDEPVSLTVSKGPELVEVPSVRAVGIEIAQERLEDAGFEVDVQKNSQYLGLGFAVSTEPGSGELAPKGSTIILYVI